MNALHCSVQAILGMAMLTAGASKLALPEPQLAPRIRHLVAGFVAFGRR